MPDAEFEPLNELESALVAAQAGEIAIPVFLQTFVESDVAVPSAEEVLADGSGLTPVLFDKNGVQMLAAFTSLERAKRVSDHARFCLVVKGRYLLTRVPRESGLVINPGFKTGFDISPIGIQEILRDF